MQLMGQCLSREDHNNIHRDHDDHDQKKKVIDQQQGGLGCCELKTNGCLAMVKEQRSRFYIARKCVVMLLCWHKYSKY